MHFSSSPGGSERSDEEAEEIQRAKRNKRNENEKLSIYFIDIKIKVLFTYEKISLSCLSKNPNVLKIQNIFQNTHI